MFNDDLAKFVDLERVIKDRTTSSANTSGAEEDFSAEDLTEDDSSPLADAA
jgi:hypothetical protein